jgi:DNA-binding CsgD family transcriptional regulator
MQRFVLPLKEAFGVNHFWYYRITYSGHYSYLGSHSEWSEFCFDGALLSHFPCLRHPNALQQGLHLMKASEDEGYKQMLQIAWDKFRINFHINLQNNIPQGIEAFGFATCFNDPKAEERLLNELPLLRQFCKIFQSKHQKLFELLEDYQVDLASQFGPVFFERPKTIALPFNRDMLLRKMGLGYVLNLTPREIDVLRFVAKGYPATYIAKHLALSRKTVENYIAIIKSKLLCNSKIELINKTQEIVSTGYLQ